MTADQEVPRYTLAYRERLHLQKDFQRILKTGRRLVHPALFIYICERPGSAEPRRMGLITRRKLGNAPRRNRLKRRLREVFRLHKHELKPGIDVIFMPQTGAADLNYHQLESIILALWGKAGLLPGRTGVSDE